MVLPNWGNGTSGRNRRLEAPRAGSVAGKEDEPIEFALGAACQDLPVRNLLLVLMVLAIWFLINHHGLFTLPP